MSFVRGCVLVSFLLMTTRGFAADVEGARALAIRAEAELAAERPVEAAKLFERAAGLEVGIGWWLAAAEAWIDAVRPHDAVAAYHSALGLRELGPEVRAAIGDQLRVAEETARLVDAARAATEDERHRVAIGLWDKAFGIVGRARYGLEAARAAARAKLWRDAEARYGEVTAADGLTREERAAIDVELAVVRTQMRAVTHTDDDEVAPWVLVGTGSAAVVFGVVALVLGDDARRDLRAAEAGAVDGRIDGLSRAEALALERDARTWSTAGIVAAGLGAGLVAVGGLWLAVEPAHDGGRVTVGARF